MANGCGRLTTFRRKGRKEKEATGMGMWRSRASPGENMKSRDVDR